MIVVFFFGRHRAVVGLVLCFLKKDGKMIVSPRRRMCAIEILESRRLMTAVTGFYLIDAATNQPVSGYLTVKDNDTINLAALPTRKITIGAYVDSTTAVKSLKFGVDGNSNFHTENYSPFVMTGDKIAWTGASVGAHTIVATPYAQQNAAGTASAVNTLHLNIIDVSNTPPTPTFTKVYNVNPSGANGAYKTISAAAALASAGDQVLIAAGTYHESLNLTRSGVAGKPITFTAASTGAVTIDGSGFKSAITGSASYITLTGLVVKNVANPAIADPGAIQVGSNWTLQDIAANNNTGTGVKVSGSNVTLLRVTANYNGMAGISGDGCSNVLVKDSITRGNNTLGNDPDYVGGAGKWMRTTNVTIDNMTSYENIGPGIWFDYNNAGAVVKNSKSYNNKGAAHAWSGNGVRIELNVGGVLVQNCTFYGNTGLNVDIQSSRNVQILNNTFTGTYLGLKDWPRGSDYTLQNITVTGNSFTGTTIYTEGGTWTTTSRVTKNITINNNTYHGSISFLWNNTFYTSLSTIRSTLGFELNGSVV